MKRKIAILMISTGIVASSCSSNNNRENKEIKLITKSELQIPGKLLTAEAMHQLGKVGDPQLSPNGKEILYGVSYTSIEENRGNRELFIINVDGTSNRQITTTPKSEQNARWIDGGAKIAYLNSGQLWVMDANGENQKQISNHKAGIFSFELSPDQTQILFMSEIPSVIKPTDEHPDLIKSSGRIIKNLMYRHWDHYVESTPRSYVASFDGKSIGKATDILGEEPFELPTLPFSGLEQLSWSPDGTKIAYSCRKLTGKDYAFSTNTDIYLYDIATKETENLTKGMMGYDTDPNFSPDGKTIAWISMEREGYEADKKRLFTIDLNTKDKKELTKEFAYNIESIVWADDNQSIYFNSCVNALTGIFNISIADQKLNRITSDKAWFDFDAPIVTGDKIITTYRCMQQPNELVSINISDGAFKQISKENEHILSQLDKVKIEERWMKTTDKKDMHTWIVYPPNFDPNKKYPAVLMCLGGPQGTISQGWSTRWNYNLIASQGYIVILPNRRGTTAFGQEWCEQISGDYIGQNMKDYFTAVDNMKKEPYVGKVAAVGASYGGYSVYYLAGIHNGRFSAFISHAGIFNQEQMYMMTEELWFPHWDNGGAPWDNNPTAKRHYSNSPHKLVKKWDTPILITHGEMDYRVPVEQGMAAFNAAQMMGVPSEMLLFPEENHWILKPQNSIHWNRTFFNWLDKWLVK